MRSAVMILCRAGSDSDICIIRLWRPGMVGRWDGEQETQVDEDV